MHSEYNPYNRERIAEENLITDFTRDVGGIIKNSAPRERDFDAIYGTKEIDKDIAETERLKRKFYENKEASPIARAAELITVEAMYDGDWLDREGFETYVKPTSTYDDYKRGVDVLFSFRKKGDKNWSYFGIDVTTSQDGSEINEKLIKTSKQIRKHKKLAELKYHHPEQNASEEEKRKPGALEIPRIVIGYTPKEIISLVKAHQKKTDRESLEKHPSQVLFRQAILDQLLLSLEIVINSDSKRKNKDRVLLEKAEDSLNIDTSTLGERGQEMANKILTAIEFIQGVMQEKTPPDTKSPERVESDYDVLNKLVFPEARKIMTAA